MSCYPLLGVWLLDKDRSLLYDLARHGLTIKGGSLDLSASGASTIVTVTSEATVTTAITADDGATVIVDKNAKTNGAETTETNEGSISSVDLSSVVAYIGGKTYTTLDAAFEAVKTGETIVLQKDITQDAGFKYDKTGVSAKLNLNGYTVTVNNGANVNNRAFKINNGTLEVYGGSIVAVGSGTNSSNGAGCYGAFRVEAGGVLNAHDLELTNSRPWGLNVKVLGGTAELTNVKITSSYGGGIEVTEADLGTHSQGGTATLTNCTFTQTGYFDHCSTALSVSGGSSLTINSGSYTSENYALYVFSSGGIITVKDGTFSGNKDGVAIVAAIDTNTYPQYTGGLQLEGGNYTGGFNITSPASMSITGGTFDHDPTSYVAEGYTTSGSNPWTVIKREGAVFNLTELQAAISNGVTPIYYAGEAITEAFTLAPAAATVINGLKVNHQTVAANATTLTINGDVTLNGAEITSKAYCGISVSEGKTVTLKDCVVDGSTAAAPNSRALNINGGATVTIDGSTVKGPSTAGYSRCINVIDEGAHVDIVNGSVLSVSHYAINLPSTTVNAVINVEDSSVNTGWAITNIWKTGNTINLTNCTLNSVNDKTQDPDNNFSAFVFNNGDGYISSNNVVTVNNCTVSVSSPSGNLQSLISMRGNNDTIKFIGSDSTISLAENGGITYQWGQLHSTLNNTLSFDKANYDQISESIDAACVVTNTNNLYTISYVTEVYYYWDTNDGQKGTYCSLADPIVRGWISDNEYIRLEKNVTLTANLTVSLSSALHVDNYFTLTLGDYSITKGNYSIILPAGLSVKTDKHTDVFTGANGAMIVETFSNDEYTYTAVQSVAQIGETKYATVKDAIAAANGMDDATITLVSDVTEAECWTATKSMTLDLNGHTYTNTATANIPASYTGTHSSYKASMMFAPAGNGTFTVDATSGGKIVVNPAAANAIGFLVSDNVKNPEYSNNEIQFVVKGKSSSDTVFEFDGNVKYGVLACYRNPSSVLSVKDAKIVSTKTTAYGVTVYLEQIGKVDMNSVCIRSSFPECVCVGDSMLDEGEKRASGTFKNCDFAQTGTGTDWTNVAINMSSNALVEVYSGTYSGNGAALSVATSGGTAKLYGGTFNGKTHRFITTGTIGYDNWAKTAIYYDPSSCNFTGSTEDTVVGSDIVAPFAAKIGSTYYVTLPEAIAAANASTGATITLLKNCETGSDYTITNPLKISGASTTLDLNGKTLTVTNNFSFCVTASNVKVQNGTLASGVNNAKTTKVNSYILVIGGIDKSAKISGVTIENVTTTGGGISAGGSEDCEVKGIAENTTIKNCIVLSGDYYAVCSQNESNLTINGGTYTASTANGCTNSKVLNASFKGSDGPEGTISVVAGTFNGAISNSNASLISITGGNFDHNPSQFVPNTHIATENGGIWTVQPKETTEGTGQGSTGGTPGPGTDPQFP